ncbi:hypothetical protein ABK040_012569 [Willaertia magna]
MDEEHGKVHPEDKENVCPNTTINTLSPSDAKKKMRKLSENHKFAISSKSSELQEGTGEILLERMVYKERVDELEIEVKQKDELLKHGKEKYKRALKESNLRENKLIKLVYEKDEIIKEQEETIKIKQETIDAMRNAVTKVKLRYAANSNNNG